jgi:hypothetical protein
MKNPITIKGYKNNKNRYKMIAEFGPGQILALKHALQLHSTQGASGIAFDILADLVVAINENEELLKKLSTD